MGWAEQESSLLRQHHVRDEVPHADHDDREEQWREHDLGEIAPPGLAPAGAHDRLGGTTPDDAVGGAEVVRDVIAQLIGVVGATIVVGAHECEPRSARDTSPLNLANSWEKRRSGERG